MNWTRGFFRAWLVLAVLWIGVTGYSEHKWAPWWWGTATAQPAEHGPWEDYRPKPPNVFDQFDPPKSAPTQPKDLPPGYVIDPPSARNITFDDLIPKSPWYADPMIWVPPFASFFAGCLLIWIARGFRRSQ